LRKGKGKGSSKQAPEPKKKCGRPPCAGRGGKWALRKAPKAGGRQSLNSGTKSSNKAPRARQSATMLAVGHMFARTGREKKPDETEDSTSVALTTQKSGEEQERGGLRLFYSSSRKKKGGKQRGR